MSSYTDGIKVELKESGAKKVFSLGELRLYECPPSYISVETRELMRIGSLISESGCLLNGGGWGEQPYWLVEAYEVYKAENARFMKDRANGK